MNLSELGLDIFRTYFTQYYTILVLVDVYYSTNLFQSYRLVVLVIVYYSTWTKRNSQLAAAKIKMTEMRHHQIW